MEGSANTSGSTLLEVVSDAAKLLGIPGSARLQVTRAAAVSASVRRGVNVRQGILSVFPATMPAVEMSDGI